VTPKPCPFCGYTFITVIEGTTFRWCKASCSYCEASGPEVRGRLDTTDVREEQTARIEAIKAWNQRSEGEK
jgi:Lar family restriction alleviation protein